MVGYLTSNKDFYKGNYHKFNLTKAIVEAGGTITHLQLYNYLLTTHFSYDNKFFHDNSAPTSILFLFPPKIQILFAALFVSEDLSIEEHITNLLLQDKDIPHYINIPTIQTILNLNNSISKLPTNHNILRLFDKNYKLPNSFIENNLKFILCLKTNNNLFDINDLSIRDKINKITKLLNYNHPYLDKFINIAMDNNRLEAGVIIGQTLGYSTSAIQNIAGIIEKWQMQNLSI